MPDHATPPPVLETLLVGTGEAASLETLLGLRAGGRVRVRALAAARRGSRFEVLTESGLPLGMIPGEDAQVLEGAGSPLPIEGEISAIVPAAGRPRVHLRFRLPVPA